jgi:hypothetical protein
MVSHYSHLHVCNAQRHDTLAHTMLTHVPGFCSIRMRYDTHVTHNFHTCTHKQHSMMVTNSMSLSASRQIWEHGQMQKCALEEVRLLTQWSMSSLY